MMVRRKESSIILYNLIYLLPFYISHILVMIQFAHSVSPIIIVEGMAQSCGQKDISGAVTASSSDQIVFALLFV